MSTDEQARQSGDVPVQSGGCPIIERSICKGILNINLVDTARSRDQDSLGVDSAAVYDSATRLLGAT